ncbi:hypothetical protein H0A71_23115 [Alcaligenaceae bacterium]|nr:hypothetical protein [Alcaligenaceae bacterium]
MLTIQCNRTCTTLMLAAAFMMVQSPVLANTFAKDIPISDKQLNGIRGGFSVQYDLGQIKVALDMSQFSFINGKLMQREDLVGASGNTHIIQNGPNNFVNPSFVDSLPTGAMGTVIQNSLDSQVISNFNVINIAVTSRQLSEAMSLKSAVRNAVIKSIF